MGGGSIIVIYGDNIASIQVTQVKRMQNDCFAHLSRLGVESKMKTTVVND